MTKRTYLLAKATLKILCLSAVLLFWLHGGDTAQSSSLQDRRENAATIDEIEGLDSLRLEFGLTQDSMFLTLEGDSGSAVLEFVPIGDIGDRDLKGSDISHAGKNPLLEAFEYTEYGATRLNNLKDNVFGGENSAPNEVVHLEYPLRSGLPDFIYESSSNSGTTSNCTEGAKIIAIAEEEGSKWEPFDFSNKKIWANITLPLKKTPGNGPRACFLLDVTLELSGQDVPLFAIDSNGATGESCGGLEIYGRGEDKLHKPGVDWACIHDLSFEQDSDDDYQGHLGELLSDPSIRGADDHFIFIENRTWSNHCGGVILLDKTGLDNGSRSLDAKWIDWKDNCNSGKASNSAEFDVLNLAALPEQEQTEFLESTRFTSGGDGSDGLTGGVGGGCSSHSTGGLNWAFCGILLGVSNGIEAIERQIYSELRIDRSDYQPENCDQADRDGACNYRDVWSNMRNLMTLAVVGTAILMVIATALDVGWFSNYTVKKYLARLIAGVVLMTMSWAIGDFIISLAGQLGGFVGSAITAPFGDAANIGLESIFSKGEIGTGVAAGTGIVAGGIIALSVGISVVPILLTAFLGLLAILAGFMFLIFRQAVIIALLIFAPVGVALWFLPGSDKMWRLYYRTFLSLVFIYPIIVGVIAFGRVFIWVLLQSDEGKKSPLLITVAFLVYVGMFMAIPILFKKFLGAINQITGGSNNPAKGIFDRVKNARSGYMNRRKEQQKRKTDHDDDKKLDKIDQAEKAGEPVSRLAKANRARIQAKRSWRYGLPFVPASQSTREWVDSARQDEESKRYQEEVERQGRAIIDTHGLNPNDFPSYVGDIETLAAGQDPSGSGRVISGAEQEAALRHLMKFKSADSFRGLNDKRATNAGLDRAWTNLLRDGSLFEAFKGTAIDVATNEIGTDNVALDKLGSKEMQTQQVETVNGWSGSLNRMIQASVDPTASSEQRVKASKKVQNFIAQLDQTVDNKMAIPNMPPGTHEALKDLKKNYDDWSDNGISQRVTSTINTANSQGLSGQQYELHLTASATDTTETLTAEMGRRAAIQIAAEDGHESTMRAVRHSTNPVIQNSLKAAIKTETLDKGHLVEVAPHLASSKLDKEGNLEPIEDFDWLKAGLDTQSLERISPETAQDMSTWFTDNLPKARTNARFRRNMQNYSGGYIRQAAINARNSNNPALAQILDQIDTDVGNLDP